MSDSYQAIYDAVRSRISNGDIGLAVENTLSRTTDTSHLQSMIQQSLNIIEWQYTRPSTMYRPRLFIDGSMWCALYGENLQDGVSGFGNSPASAYEDFDNAWHTSLDAEVKP